MPFIPHTSSDIEKMLDAIGVSTIDQLFDEIPPSIRAQHLTQVPDGVSEMQIMREMTDYAAQDAGFANYIGAGAYEHHIPAAVWQTITRGEYYTAYTPYQAEASQGTLQTIYEYQTMIASLTGMDVSNASVYDGASGLAEAVLMAVRANRKSKSKRILMAKTVNPLYRKATHNIVVNQEIMIDDIPLNGQGKVDIASLSTYEEQDYAALVIAQPNFFGNLEAVNQLTDWAHAQGMLVIAVVNPTSLALLKPPGQWGESGADIAVGDGQPLGIPLSSGGPYFGFLCCKQAIVRQMPGRIIGKTVDTEGKEGYVLTLQAREQHIRRSKATSNICTNQGLAMAAATIYMSLLGAEGIKAVALASHQNTQKLTQLCCDLDGVTQAFKEPTFHEVVLDLPVSAEKVINSMLAKGILAGYSLAELDRPNSLLVCVTETKTDDDLSYYAKALNDTLIELKVVQDKEVVSC